MKRFAVLALSCMTVIVLFGGCRNTGMDDAMTPGVTTHPTSRPETQPSTRPTNNDHETTMPSIMPSESTDTNRRAQPRY